MFAKQLTVFLENRAGRLSGVLGVLKENGINVLSLSLADTTEFGLLRLIVDKPALGKEKLSECGFSSLLSDVSIIKIPHEVGALQTLLSDIDKDGVNIEYMYGLSTGSDNAYIVLKTGDAEKIDKILAEQNIDTVGSEDLVNG
ncbi:MAG: amino acid-binding protein [Clostridia bacterium]|nr:amino acid-binding protein [Clostridia bacterium]